MNLLHRSVGVVGVVALVALAGCSLPVVDSGAAETGTPQAGTPSPSGGTPTEVTEVPPPGGTGTPTPTTTATPTATPTPHPTPTVESETGIRVVEINADVEAVHEEYIVLKNTGDSRLDMSGWRVKNEDDDVYTFPDGFSLGIDDTVTLHSSRGTQSESDRFWWSDGQQWDANGDTISIFDDRGHEVYERSYS